MEKSRFYVSCTGNLCLTRTIEGKAPIVIVIDKVINVRITVQFNKGKINHAGDSLEFSGRIINTLHHDK